jgi:hypothetical protein
VLAAIDAVREITGSPDVNLIGFCAGGIIATTVLNYVGCTRNWAQHPGSTCVTWRRPEGRAQRSGRDPATLRPAYAATAACRVGCRSVPVMLVIIGLVAPAAR